jgi:fructose-specific phosphotransferase system IIA component
MLVAGRPGKISPEDAELLHKHKIIAYDIEGPLFFGAAKNFVRDIEQQSNFRVIILNMENVPVIDTTGALALEDIVDRLNRDRKKLIIAGMRKEVRAVLHRLGISQKIGVGHFAGDLRRAIRDAVAHVTGEGERLLLGSFLDQDLIMLDVRARTKEELFDRMADRAQRAGFIADKAAFERDLWEREEAGSTGLANGVAIPHSRSGSAGRMVILVARLSEPVPYESLDNQPIRLVFMIAASQDDDAYLRILSLLAKSINSPGVTERLLAAPTTHDLYDLLAHEIENETDTKGR